jgi:hypothetical protein
MDIMEGLDGVRISKYFMLMSNTGSKRLQIVLVLFLGRLKSLDWTGEIQWNGFIGPNVWRRKSKEEPM